jgi:hypothetical protein
VYLRTENSNSGQREQPVERSRGRTVSDPAEEGSVAGKGQNSERKWGPDMIQPQAIVQTLPFTE